jgi:hypothetical protein
LETQNSSGSTAGHHLVQIGQLARDHALLLSPGKRARAVTGCHAAHTPLTKGAASGAAAQSAEAAGTRASAASAGRTAAEATTSAAASAKSPTTTAAVLLRARNFDRGQANGQYNRAELDDMFHGRDYIACESGATSAVLLMDCRAN